MVFITPFSLTSDKKAVAGSVAIPELKKESDENENNEFS